MTQMLEILTIDKLEEVKKKAIEKLDSVMYMRVCDALGMEPDVPDLYNQGLIDFYLRRFGSEMPEIRKGTEKQTMYSEFFNEWQRSHINERDYLADCDKKTRSLLRFSKFRENGKQPISGYSCEDIGHLYSGVLETAKKSRGQ